MSFCVGRQHTACNGEQKAERIIGEELRRVDWPEEALRAFPKGHPVKVALARRLRKDTTMSLKWIAARLHMGSWTYVSNLVAAHSQPSTVAQPALPLFQ